MKYFTLTLLAALTIFSCNKKEEKISPDLVKKEITTNIEAWHKAAADADFEAYFSLMTEDGVFIGTDASENWQLKDFKSYSKPHFDKGKAWQFTTLERHVYLDETQNLAWFDELLDTQMEICRGSGVVEKVNGLWKVKHYVLSITIPNNKVSDVIVMKKEIDRVTKAKLRE
ncbi:nuclear transport factor 2 family protein [Olleya namhaensis]|uniref:nuclear transport factor 2 family protein n=1 Tax=Olleya namhaensis TaxID=1144750 RepID=UPI0024924D0F|nr:nuclear transport factor 2 family protein [Olleya namhaensis]